MVSHIKQNIYHEIINHYEPYKTKKYEEYEVYLTNFL